VFTPKRREFVARYLSDISKLIFAAGVVKQFFEQELNWFSLLIGIIAAAIIFWLGLIAQPQE